MTERFSLSLLFSKVVSPFVQVKDACKPTTMSSFGSRGKLYGLKQVRIHKRYLDTVTEGQGSRQTQLFTSVLQLTALCITQLLITNYTLVLPTLNT